MKLNKKTRSKIKQILAPLVIILIILGLFGIYHMIKLNQPASEEPQTQAGLVTCEDLGCPEGAKYIGSANSNVYHECSSGYAQTILPDNRVCFMSAKEAEEAGYHPAANLQVV